MVEANQNNINTVEPLSAEVNQTEEIKTPNPLLSHFVLDTDITEFEVDGLLFKYKAASSEDDYRWAKSSVIDGKIDYSLLTRQKLENLIETPYDNQTIKTVLNIEKSWAELSINERWDFTRVMKSRVFDEILTNIEKINAGEVVVKNL